MSTDAEARDLHPKHPMNVVSDETFHAPHIFCLFLVDIRLTIALIGEKRNTMCSTVKVRRAASV